MSNVQIVFGASSAKLVDWVVRAVLAVTPAGFVGVRWGQPVDGDADLVIFVTDDGQVDPGPIRTALHAGLTVFFVTGEEGTVFPTDLNGITGEGRIYFFHTRVPTAQEGFIPFRFLAPAIQRLLSGLPLDDLGKEE